MPDIDPGDDLIPLPPSQGMSRRFSLGLLTGIAALTLSVADFSHQDPQPLMAHPDKTENVLDTLIRVYSNSKLQRALFKGTAHFVHMSPVEGNTRSIYDRSNFDEVRTILNDDEMNAGEMAYRLIEKLEGNVAGVYLDSEGLPTVGVGVLLPKPGVDRAREKRIEEATGLEYDDIRNGKVALTPQQAMACATSFIGKFDNELLATLIRATEDEDVATDDIEPRYLACILAMKYQSPAFLEGARWREDKEQIRGVTYPCLQDLTSFWAWDETQEEAMHDLLRFNAMDIQMDYASDESNFKMGMRNALLDAALSEDGRNSADFVAAQIGVLCKKEYPIIVLDGLPLGTAAKPVSFQHLLENKLCQFNREGGADIFVPALGLMAQQRGNKIEVTSAVNPRYKYTLDLDKETVTHEQALYTHFAEKLAAR